MGHLFTISPHLSVVDVLAQGLLERTKDDRLKLRDYLIVLPSRRACRMLREAFLRQTDGKPLLLPDMQTLGDFDEDILSLKTALHPELYAEFRAIKPAVDDLTRRVLLAQLIEKHAPEMAPSFHAAYDLAETLCGLIDRMLTEKVDMSKLSLALAQDFAAHWQVTLDFLKIITEQWPQKLLEMGLIEKAERQLKLTDLFIRAWQYQPPKSPVLIVGSVGPTPAARALIKAVYDLPLGEVILPAFDHHLDEQGWLKLEQDHAQYALKKLLAFLQAERQMVKPWQAPEMALTHPRSAFLSEVLRPTHNIELWQDLPVDAFQRNATEDLSLLVAQNPQQEAEYIAMVMRGVLEHEGKTAALITPDRQLARRVSSCLLKWDIHVDDSGGISLATVPVMHYLRLVIVAVSEGLSTLPFLSLLKNPYCRLGMTEAEYHEKLILFERYILRGYKIENNISSYLKILERLKADEDFDNSDNKIEKLSDFIAKLAIFFTPLLQKVAEGQQSPQDVLKDHLMLAEALAKTPEQSGQEKLWFGDESVQKTAEFIHTLAQILSYLPRMSIFEYRLFFEKTVLDQKLRLPYGLHPRLSILGAIEGRLYSPDVIILGGLNEGKWPKDPAADPYLSRPMRRALGLPQAEYEIGLAAHDFYAYAATPKVFMTYARKQEGAPLQPSRWILRLEALLDKTQLPLGDEADWIKKWHHEMQAQGQNSQSYARPCPKPPLDKRPKQLSVTQVEKLFNNPYQIYVEKILKLRELDELDQTAEQRLRGSTLHLALEYFLKDNRDLSLEKLIACGQRAFAEMNVPKQEYDYWWPRFLNMAENFVNHEQNRRREGFQPKVIEEETSYDFQVEGVPFRLIAKVDRIDQTADGAAEIIDYKTGQNQVLANIKNGKTPQLPLEGYMLQQGCFPQLTTQTISAFHYYNIGGSRNSGLRIRGVEKEEEIMMAVDNTYQRLYDTIYYYQNETHGYQASSHYKDYEAKLKHFARASEWAVEDDEEATETNE